MKNQFMIKGKEKLMIVFIAISLSFNVPLQSQEIKPVFMSVSDGIASPGVNGVIQDSYGLIWIGTRDGLQKYDGLKLETFKNIPGDPSSLQNNNIWTLCEDAEHNIWIGTDSGVSKYNRKNKTFTNYNFNKLFKRTGNISSALVLFQDSGNRIWATTGFNSIVSYNHETDTWNASKIRPSENAESSTIEGLGLGITEDSNEIIWSGSYQYGLIYLTPSDSIFRPAKIKQTDYIPFTDSWNTISDVYADSADIIWITTRNGIYKYNPSTTHLKTIIIYDYNRESRLNQWNRINSDDEGNIWIANNFHGLLKFNGLSDEYSEIKIAGNIKLLNQGWNKTLTSFTVDKSGIFWFGTISSGVMKYDPAKNPFELFVHNEKDKNSLSNSSVFGLFESKVKPEILYVGTRGGGLNIFDEKKKIFHHVTYKAVNDLYGGAVRCIGEMDDGSLLLGTWGDGLIKLDKNYNEIRRFAYSSDPTSISDDKVRVIRKDHKGNFWIGTNNGLNYFYPASGTFRRIPSKMLRTLSPELIEQIESVSDPGNKIAEIVNVTDFQNLSQQFEISKTDTFTVEVVGEGRNFDGMFDYGWIENANKDTIWNAFDYARSYYAGGASKNRMFIDQIILSPGSYTLRYTSDDSHSYAKWNEAPPDKTKLYGILLVRLPDKNAQNLFSTLLSKNKKEKAINGTDISDIIVRDKYLWVAAIGAGLNKINLENNAVKTYSNDPENPNSISGNNIQDICEDKNGTLWLTTQMGITQFDPGKEQFTLYTQEDGLPTNLTESILEGDNGEMWISTQNGLSQMISNQSLGNVTFINYNTEDGLGGSSYVNQAAVRTRDGKFWFGGEHGLNSVSRITANNVEPDLLLTDLLILNKSVYNKDYNSLLSTSLPDLKELQLTHDQNNLSFEFAALHYANPQKNQYAHILKGYEDEWTYDNRNYASYTNLPPGEYDFIFRASNAYGVWNETGKSLHIVIAPPWWYTWWAFIIYAFILGASIYYFNKQMRRRLVLQERERTREKELAQAKEIEKAYNELKATQAQLVQSEKMASLGELTAGIAHEIQNPLNFVNNFSEVSIELIDEIKSDLSKGEISEISEIADDIKQNLEKINHHGKRADGIVKNMLMHSRGNTGEKLPTDINALADEYLRLSYHGLRARDKAFNANFRLDADEKLPKINLVSQDIGRVLLNLINNAFYAVYEKSKSNLDGYKPEVVVSTKRQGDTVLIKVKDNGNGIPDNVKEKIFQPFFTTKPAGQGTGLGLSMSYDIVTKGHNGEIEINSKESEGTEFIIKIPLK
ncbi:two-component regulator propeller domain-containing protein [Saccharicrinis sp. FJH62]|uniref:sensor histidine kinase n=1 Tax=Saccharicrinis sp. FJH62 TaxID=3344657 RepID=UPI0035D470E2